MLATLGHMTVPELLAMNPILYLEKALKMTDYEIKSFTPLRGKIYDHLRSAIIMDIRWNVQAANLEKGGRQGLAKSEGPALCERAAGSQN